MVEQVDRDFREWIVTVEQADAIAAGDSEALYKFYTDNYQRLELMADHYRHRMNVILGNNAYNTQDMMSNLYIDLPHMNWKNALTLTQDIKQLSFHWSASGGYTMRKEYGLRVRLDTTIKGEYFHLGRASKLDASLCFLSTDELLPGADDTTYGDSLRAPREYEADFVRGDDGLSAEKICELLQDIVVTPLQRKVFLGMLYGYYGNMLGEFCGLSGMRAARVAMDIKRKLVLYYDKVLRILEANGMLIPRYLVGVEPDAYKDVIAKHEKEMARNKEYYYSHSNECRQKQKEYAQKKRVAKRAAKIAAGEYVRPIYATEEERREANKQKKLEWQRKKRAEERKAREAAQATAEQTPVTSGLA